MSLDTTNSPNSTGAGLEDTFGDVTSWYSSRTIVADTSSFQILAVSVTALVSSQFGRERGSI
jgi:hypothetical protein